MYKKKPREKGKLKFRRIFQELKVGDKVAVSRELSEPANFPRRIEGNTGIIEGRRGNAYIIKLKDMNQEKRFIIKAIHIIKIGK